MRVLLIGAGASFSTKDVENGYSKALRAAGHDVGLYLLDKRLGMARSYLAHYWRHAGKPEKRPTYDDILYLASEEIAQRACFFEPDWVLFVAGRMVHPTVWVALKHAGIKTALLATEMPYDEAWLKNIAPLLDVVCVNERSSVAVIREFNPRTYYMGPAFDPDVHRPDAYDPAEELVPRHDVVFVGSHFPERARLLAQINWLGHGLDFALYGNWKALGSRSPLRYHVAAGVVDNTITAALYRRSLINLNLYRQGQGWTKNAPPVEHAESLNPRAVELAACGAFTISDYRAEVAEVFGDAVPTFKTAHELQTIMLYYLEHEDKRQECAKRLPGLIAGHTFNQRVTALMHILEN